MDHNFGHRSALVILVNLNRLIKSSRQNGMKLDCKHRFMVKKIMTKRHDLERFPLCSISYIVYLYHYLIGVGLWGRV